MDLLYALQQMRTPSLDQFFLLVTRLGEELFVLAPLLLFYWCIDRKMGLRIGFTYFACGLAGQFAKLVFAIPRPFVQDTRLIPPANALASATGYSFPSGHTTSAVSLVASFVANWKSKWWVWVLSSVYVGLVGFSRLYLGVHTLQDVLGALLLSIVCAVLVECTLRDCEKRPEHTKYYVCLCIGLVLAIVAIVIVRIQFWSMPIHQGADGIKTVGASIGLLLGVYLERRFVRFDVRAPHVWQVVKLLLGLVLAMLLKEGLKAVWGQSLPMEFLRYFIVVAFVVVGYPAAFGACLGKLNKSEG